MHLTYHTLPLDNVHDRPALDFSFDVLPYLPDWRDAAAQMNTFPDDLIGATILRFGAAPPGSDIEGGGLVIDYRPAGARDAKRLVLAFTELGMWTEYLGLFVN